MKKLMMILGATAAWFGFMAAPLSAQDAGEEPASEQACIPAALDEVKYLTSARPKEKVKVYYLLRSDSGCGICVHLAPEFVKIHKKMRGKGAELILLSGDASDDKAIAWAKSAKMTYPVVSPTDRSKVPFSFDFGGASVTKPLIVAVSPDGEKLGQASGPDAAKYVADWKKLVAEQKKKERAAGDSADAEPEEKEQEEAEDAEETADAEPSIPDVLSKVEFIGKARPKKKSYVYFFIRSHSGCGPCKSIVPKCIDLYKEMKGKGAEMIMLNCGHDAAAEKSWVEASGMTYPVVSPDSAGQVDVPSGGSGGTPNVVAVTASGELIEGTSGASKCPALMARWKEFVKDAKKQEQAEKKKASAKKSSGKKKSKKRKKAEESEDDEEL